MLDRARWLAAVTAAALVCLPAYAAEAQNDRTETASERVTETKAAESKAPAKESRPTGIADVDVCRQQAQGLEGPARARFMTACLKRN